MFCVFFDLFENETFSVKIKLRLKKKDQFWNWIKTSKNKHSKRWALYHPSFGQINFFVIWFHKLGFSLDEYSKNLMKRFWFENKKNSNQLIQWSRTNQTKCICHWQPKPYSYEAIWKKFKENISRKNCIFFLFANGNVKQEKLWILKFFEPANFFSYFKSVLRYS